MLTGGLLPRNGTKPAYPFQQFTEHLRGQHHFSKLEHKPPGVTHQPSIYLDESRLNTCKRPPLCRFWQRQCYEEVAQVVGQDEYSLT